MRIWSADGLREIPLPPHSCMARIAHGGQFVALSRGDGCRLVSLYRIDGEALRETANWPVASEPNIEISPDDSRILVMDRNGAMLLRVPAP